MVTVVSFTLPSHNTLLLPFPPVPLTLTGITGLLEGHHLMSPQWKVDGGKGSHGVFLLQHLQVLKSLCVSVFVCLFLLRLGLTVLPRMDWNLGPTDPPASNPCMG
jgi:hypothetical protein